MEACLYLLTPGHVMDQCCELFLDLLASASHSWMTQWRQRCHQGSAELSAQDGAWWVAVKSFSTGSAPPPPLLRHAAAALMR